MEYVIVRYPTRRLVYIDDEENGNTNSVLRIGRGTHVFTLGSRANFRPAQRTVTVRNTSVLEPLEIRFFPKDDA